MQDVGHVARQAVRDEVQVYPKRARRLNLGSTVGGRAVFIVKRTGSACNAVPVCLSDIHLLLSTWNFLYLYLEVWLKDTVVRDGYQALILHEF